MRQRKTPPPPIIDTDPKKPTRPFGGASAPFTSDEGKDIRDQLTRLTPDLKKTDKAFSTICAAMLECQIQLTLEAIPLLPTVDVRKTLKTAAKTGRFNQKKQWLRGFLEYGANKTGINVASVMASDPNAVRKAALAALDSKLLMGTPGKKKATAQREYIAVLHKVYTNLTKSKPSFTRSADQALANGRHMVRSGAADLFRAAMAPLGASDDKIAEAILGRK